MNTTRTERRDIIALRSAALVYELGDGQWFCETNKAYEIWGLHKGREGMEIRIKRIPKSAIYWVCTN